MPNPQEVLHGPFSPELHKKTFIGYFEAVIRPDGVVEYAVPSHTEKLIKVLEKRLNTDREGVYDACPLRYFGDVAGWLTKETGYLMVWEGFYLGQPNQTQLETLQKLQEAGIYLGEIRGVGEELLRPSVSL